MKELDVDSSERMGGKCDEQDIQMKREEERLLCCAFSLLATCLRCPGISCTRVLESLTLFFTLFPLLQADSLKGKGSGTLPFDPAIGLALLRQTHRERCIDRLRSSLLPPLFRSLQRSFLLFQQPLCSIC